MLSQPKYILTLTLVGLCVLFYQFDAKMEGHKSISSILRMKFTTKVTGLVGKGACNRRLLHIWREP